VDGSFEDRYGEGRTLNDEQERGGKRKKSWGRGLFKKKTKERKQGTVRTLDDVQERRDMMSKGLFKGVFKKNYYLFGQKW
jgi:hypothetical protein